MRIGIFETDHYEVSSTLIKLFDNGKNDITVFAYPQSWRQFRFLFPHRQGSYHWVIKEEKEPWWKFMVRIYKETRRRKLELLYLNTVTQHHLPYALLIKMLPGVRVIVTIHDSNGYFQWKPAWSVRRLVRYIGKRLLVRTVKEFNVLSPTLVPALQSRLPANKIVHVIPGAVYEGRRHMVATPATCNQIKLVVPGTVDVRRRDYATVFDLLEACRQQSLPVSVVLLGGYYGEAGKAVIEKCKARASQAADITSYETSVVDQPEFDRQMDEAHLLFIPSRIHTILADGVPETYGLTISSGNVSDIIRYAKPFIAPAALTLPANLESGAVRYQHVADIVRVLQQLLSDDAWYHQLSRQAVLNAQEYTIEKIRQQNPAFFGVH